DSLVINGKALANNGWSVHIAQKKVAADLSYYPKQNRLDGFISYLHLAALGNEPVTSSLTPGQIPNLNLRIDDLSVGDIKIGNVTLKSHSSVDKWTIDYCRVESPVYQGAISGDWTQKEGSNFSRLEAKIHSSNLAESLERWHISPVVHAGTGDMEIQGSWRGRLYDFSLANLDGSMALKLNNGRITDLSKETEEKLGLGKLLSILSLQTIPRRLKLDFSDLSHQGYSFDVFKGSFDIKKGVMNTQDSYIDGPVAYASMKGTLDLKHQLYDLNLRISPHITASLPVVATIAGGPIAGLAAWVANKIISQSMQKIIAYSYKVSGPWSQPVVQQISIVRQITKK
ncbi:MAG: YhdP family protein, partial [Legionella sp.]